MMCEFLLAPKIRMGVLWCCFLLGVLLWAVFGCLKENRIQGNAKQGAGDGGDPWPFGI